jgi:hypothetical protein
MILLKKVENCEIINTGRPKKRPEDTKGGKGNQKP